MMARASRDQMPVHFAMEVRGSISGLLEFEENFRGYFFLPSDAFSRVSIRSPSLIGKHKGSPHWS